MPNVKITRNGETIEIMDLSFEQAKELAGLNGHGKFKKKIPQEPHAEVVIGKNGNPQYSEFSRLLTPNSHKFFLILRAHPMGIAADNLAEAMGLKGTTQIGGLVGGGIGKLAPRFNIDIRKLYKKEVRFDKGERKVIYRPGIDVDQVSL
jgi:hypothetical protein